MGKFFFAIHQNFFFRDDVITHTILSVKGQLDGNGLQTTNFVKNVFNTFSSLITKQRKNWMETWLLLQSKLGLPSRQTDQHS